MKRLLLLMVLLFCVGCRSYDQRVARLVDGPGIRWTGTSMYYHRVPCVQSYDVDYTQFARDDHSPGLSNPNWLAPTTVQPQGRLRTTYQRPAFKGFFGTQKGGGFFGDQ